MRVDELAKIVDQFKVAVLDRLKSIDDKIQSLMEGNEKIESRLKWVEDKLSRLEDQSRRENLLFFGIKESKDETWDETERKISQFMKEKMGIDREIVFHRVHRLGRPRQGVNSRPIIAKFLLYKDKDLVLKNARKLKDTGFSVSEDFCEATREKRKMLLPHLKRAKAAKQRAFLKVDTLHIEGTVFHVVGECVKNKKTGQLITWEN